MGEQHVDRRLAAFWRGLLLCLLIHCGCTALPQRWHEPQFHNPFPQLHRVAVLPFFNQSNEPTLDGLAVATAYRNELQKIPGFEVMPVGVVDYVLRANQIQLDGATDFQQLARMLNVDAVVVGAVTDFHEYYPPRMGLAVNWYAADERLHPIPPGYGLPWGTSEEEFIPRELIYEAEFALARRRLQTDTATEPGEPLPPQAHASGEALLIDWADAAGSADQDGSSESARQSDVVGEPNAASVQSDAVRRGPIMSLVRQYHGNDADFTRRLAAYYRSRDDERFGGWQSYLQRKDDFIRFCCYLHITEMLAARGGAGQTRVVWRWPGDRY